MWMLLLGGGGAVFAQVAELHELLCLEPYNEKVYILD
jgi:hypothetical protein